VSGRSLGWVLTRKRVLIPGVIGLVLLVGGGFKVAGVILLGVAFLKAVRLLDSDDLDRRLSRRHARHSHGVWRHLYTTEAAEMEVIEAYARDLAASGADPALAKETQEEAWRIVQRHGDGDATIELRRFRQSLPPLVSESRPGGGVAEKIRAELDLLHATRKEMQSIS
jgi:hypothetical protein